MRVLVVEDDRKIGSFVIAALHQAGFAVDYAEDGASGLDLALAAPLTPSSLTSCCPGWTDCR